jgi:platelet-activating factor acetylhydrolase IB subunit alpha
MSLLLTERQRADLNAAILEYLISQADKFPDSAECFKREAGITETTDSGKGLLEKKWTSVVRLQKKVMELEAKVETMKQRGGVEAAFEGSTVIAPRSGENMGDSKLLPRPPAKSTLKGHRASVTSIAIHPVYSYFASASEDSTIRMWDFETAQYERTLKGHTGPVTSVVFDAKGGMLASCSADMSAKLWDMTTYACTKTLKGHDHTLSAILFVPSGDQVATCSRDQTVRLWEVSSGYCLRTYVGHADWVKCVSISLNGTHLASGSSDQSIIVWELSTGKQVQVSSAFCMFYLSPIDTK